MTWDEDTPPPMKKAAQGWTRDQLERKGLAEAGGCVVANMRKAGGKGVDGALVAWAKANERFVRIDRKTEWGNPFEMPGDGERADVVAKFEKFYWPHKDALLARVPTLAGRVLACWCHPEACHGHTIADTFNRWRESGESRDQLDAAEQRRQAQGAAAGSPAPPIKEDGPCPRPSPSADTTPPAAPSRSAFAASGSETGSTSTPPSAAKPTASCAPNLRPSSEGSAPTTEPPDASASS